jgi:hypothetical protein
LSSSSQSGLPLSLVRTTGTAQWLRRLTDFRTRAHSTAVTNHKSENATWMSVPTLTRKPSLIPSAKRKSTCD